MKTSLQIWLPFIILLFIGCGWVLVRTYGPHPVRFVGTWQVEAGDPDKYYGRLMMTFHENGKVQIKKRYVNAGKDVLRESEDGFWTFESGEIHFVIPGKKTDPCSAVFWENNTRLLVLNKATGRHTAYKKVSNKPIALPKDADSPFPEGDASLRN